MGGWGALLCFVCLFVWGGVFVVVGVCVWGGGGAECVCVCVCVCVVVVVVVVVVALNPLQVLEKRSRMNQEGKVQFFPEGVSIL